MKIIILVLSVVALLCDATAICFMTANGCMSEKQIIELSKQQGVLMGGGDNIAIRKNLKQTKHNSTLAIIFIILGIIFEISSRLLRWMVEQKDNKLTKQVFDKILEHLEGKDTRL